MSPSQLPSNVFYGQLNRRFEHRARLLRRFGFRYVNLSGIGLFTRVRWTREQSVAAATVMSAHNRIWRELVLRPLLSL